jgi:CO/xanthine dehydrogenase Mo-binding subunit
MNDLFIIGKSVPRKEAKDKVTGTAKYTNDYSSPGMLYARLVTSSLAHAKIKKIDTSEASGLPGIRAIITGEYFPYLIGSTVQDQPIIAIDKVRYFGEPVAIVVDDSEAEAMRAVQLIKVDYEPLPVVNSPSEAVKRNAPLIHEKLGAYKKSEDVYPEANANIANRTKIRKGDVKKGWEESDITLEASFSFPPSDHVAMETRCAQVEILPDGRVIIYSTSQSPFEIKKLISSYFDIKPGNVIVNVPLVGGAYGGKTPVQWEPITYLASKAVGGRLVKLTATREEDLTTFPVHIGLEAKVKLGCTKRGQLKVAEITYLFDGGAYSDRAVIISKAAGVDCTGPYRIDNVWCDSLCVYTNHPYATAFRGFGHSELTFVMERTIDLLANKLDMDPLELRLRNAIVPGDTTPTQTKLNNSNLGNLPMCIQRVSELINWQEGERIEISNNKVRAKGISCFWKNSNSPTNAEAGVILTFNIDGSINLICGVVELGQGTKTALAQILAERMKMNVYDIYVMMEVNTQTAPDHWKTAASKSVFMVGRAVINAAEDATQQLFKTASIVLRCSPDDLDIGGGRVFLKQDINIGIDIKEIAHGYTYPNGNSIEGQVIGRGKYIINHLTILDPDTGRGNPGPGWTVGAQAVEVEFDTKEYTYKILKAASVIDAGKVINAMAAKGQVMGGMSMGLSFASKEAFLFNDKGIIQNPSLRLYKIIYFGEQPEYLVDFLENPQIEGPYGARGIGEYGIIGMPGALANSLSTAANVPLNELPLIPELIWKTKKGEKLCYL